MINVQISLPNDNINIITASHKEGRHLNFLYLDMIKPEKEENKIGAYCGLLFPALWNNFFHPQDDLS